MAVFDVFMFFNELDLLEFRLNYLNDYVDTFVICESDKTFTNQFKGLILNKNHQRFEKFKKKMIIINTTFNNKNPWLNENEQRNVISKALNGLNDKDIIIFTDIDEIPDPEVISKSFDSNNFNILSMKTYYGYMNMRAPWVDWTGGKMIKYKIFNTSPASDIRYVSPEKSIFNRFPVKVIKNAGWHFSWLGGVENIVKKIEAYAHQEHNNSILKNKSRIYNCLKNRKDLFGGNNEYIIESVKYPDFPKYLVDNIDKYKNYIYENAY